MGIAPTYIDRSHTNAKVFHIANEEKGANADTNKAKIIPITETNTNRNNTLLGHVIRAGNRDLKDPMYQVTFDDESLKPKRTTYRRAGRPRHKWHDYTLESKNYHPPKSSTINLKHF